MWCGGGHRGLRPHHLDKSITQRILSHGPITMTMAMTAVLVQMPGDGAMQGPRLVQHFLPHTSFLDYLGRSSCFEVSINHRGRHMIQLKEEIKAIYG